MKSSLIVICYLGLVGCGSPPVSTVEGKNPPAASLELQVDSQTQQQLGVQVQPAATGSLAVPITATGQLQLNQDKTWHVGAAIEGKIVAVPVHLGDTVKAGEVIAQLHSHEVHDSRADRRQAVAELQRLKVMADQAQRVRDRTRRLFNLKAASREQVEAAETQYQSGLLSVANAQAEVDRTESHLTEFLDVPLQDADRNKDGVDGADSVPIKAPSAGTVMERLANVGTVVSTGDPVIVVADLSSLWLIASVNEANLSQIRIGQTVRIAVRAYPEKIFPGKVFQLGERLDPQTRTLQVRVLVSNPEGKLKPDMFATAEFLTKSERSAVLVPESAVQELKGRSVVFVQTPSGAFAATDVVTGSRVERQIEIVSGLTPGTPVVVTGALLLRAQMLKSAAN